ncbi:phage holin [Staphylococcus auricularis]|uniref:Phage holin n=1 Tax=Staphylococcus auricularis TaxID=29379 RepID=A0AAW7MCC5_9STAP|nr:phage holin [Staphylococcus auricularis]MCG7342500.1 phage holin [Staphylococcus auricularis]MDN4532926.1 phage holin [Staphylococcus auricularis]
MNWKLRFKNKPTLVAIVGACLLLVKQVTELFGLDLSAQLEQIADILGTLILLLVTVGIINDPTTEGVNDTELVKQYNKPRKQGLMPVDFVKPPQKEDENVAPEAKAKEIEDFDTNQPFTDDSDEVDFDVADDEVDETLKRGASAYHDDQILKEDDENASETN